MLQSLDYHPCRLDLACEYQNSASGTIQKAKHIPAPQSRTCIHPLHRRLSPWAYGWNPWVAECRSTWKLLAVALVKRDGRRHTNLAREVNKLFCSKIAMQKSDLSNRVICVVKLYPLKFNYFVACCAPHETLGEPIHKSLVKLKRNCQFCCAYLIWTVEKGLRNQWFPLLQELNNKKNSQVHCFYFKLHLR